jgi:hypothetical protein
MILQALGTCFQRMRQQFKPWTMTAQDLLLYSPKRRNLRAGDETKGKCTLGQVKPSGHLRWNGQRREARSRRWQGEVILTRVDTQVGRKEGQVGQFSVNDLLPGVHFWCWIELKPVSMLKTVPPLTLTARAHPHTWQCSPVGTLLNQLGFSVGSFPTFLAFLKLFPSVCWLLCLSSCITLM